MAANPYNFSYLNGPGFSQRPSFSSHIRNNFWRKNNVDPCVDWGELNGNRNSNKSFPISRGTSSYNAFAKNGNYPYFVNVQQVKDYNTQSQNQYSGNVLQYDCGIPTTNIMPPGKTFVENPPLPPAIPKPPLPKEPHPLALPPPPPIPRLFPYWTPKISAKSRNTYLGNKSIPDKMLTSLFKPLYFQPLSKTKEITKAPTTVPKQDRLAEFTTYKTIRFDRLGSADKHEKRRVMESITQSLAQFVPNKKLNDKEIEDICDNLANNYLLKLDTDRIRVILWTLVSIIRFYVNKRVEAPEAGNKTMERIIESFETAFLTSFPKLGLGSNPLLLEEVVAMLNNLSTTTKTLWPNKTKSLLRKRLHFCWSAKIETASDDFRLYFSREKEAYTDKNINSANLETDKTPSKPRPKRLSQIFRKWRKIKLCDRRENAVEEILRAAIRIRKRYAEKDGEEGIKKMIQALEFEGFNENTIRSSGVLRAGLYISLLWVAAVATQRGENHAKMCAIVVTAMRVIYFIAPAEIEEAGVSPLELWSIYYTLRKTWNGQACLCSEVSSLIHNLFPNATLQRDEARRRPKPCEYFFRKREEIFSAENSTKTNFQRTPTIVAALEKVTDGDEKRRKLRYEDVYTSSLLEEDEKVQSDESDKEERKLKKSERRQEKVFLIPQSRPLSLDEILKGNEMRNNKTFNQALENDDKQNEIASLGTEFRDSTNRVVDESSVDKTWPSSKSKEPKTINGNPSIGKFESVNADTKQPPHLKADNPFEEIHNFEEEFVLVSLQNPFCRKQYVDLVSISRKQGIKRSESGLQLVFFLEKSEEAENVKKALENEGQNLCQCCNYE